MGTWDSGILDNDAAGDSMGELAHGVVTDIVSLGSAPPTRTSVARLGAAIGILLQLSDYWLQPDSPSASKIFAVISHHEPMLTALSAKARKLLVVVRDGRAKELARGARGKSDDLFHASGRHATFGVHQAALFEGRDAGRYVQEIADRCVEAIDDDLESVEVWSDMCRESNTIGHLAALTALSPCKVSARKIEEWRRRAKQGLTELRETGDSELEFHETFYANLDGVYRLLLRRFKA